jgi:hypothetical protein
VNLLMPQVWVGLIRINPIILFDFLSNFSRLINIFIFLLCWQNNSNKANL